jgi:hypothetical protein
LADSDDDADDNGAPPPPPRQQLASETTSNELDVAQSGVGQSGAGPGGYNPSPEPKPPQPTAANVADAPAAAPARPTRSGAADEPHTDVLASRLAAVAQVTTSAAIAVTDVGQPGAGFDGHIPSPALGPPPGAAASMADAAAMPATAPVRVPRADAEREQHESALTSYHSGNALPDTPSQKGLPPVCRRNLASDATRRRRRVAGENRQNPCTRGTFAQWAAIPVWMLAHC